MKKKRENRIYIKDQYKIILASIFGSCLFITTVITRYLKDKISFETGICADCSIGIRVFDKIFQILNNPIPTIFFLIILLGLFALVSSILTSFIHIGSLEEDK